MLKLEIFAFLYIICQCQATQHNKSLNMDSYTCDHIIMNQQRLNITILIIGIINVIGSVVIIMLYNSFRNSKVKKSTITDKIVAISNEFSKDYKELETARCEKIILNRKMNRYNIRQQTLSQDISQPLIQNMLSLSSCYYESGHNLSSPIFHNSHFSRNSTESNEWSESLEESKNVKSFMKSLSIRALKLGKTSNSK